MVAALALGVSTSSLIVCDKGQDQGTQTPSDSGDADDGGNFCKVYATCDECIDGQIAKGKTEGEAETQCGAAVLGCWATWTKPIVCHGEGYRSDGTKVSDAPASDSTEAPEATSDPPAE
jgi:hypothetical protein